MAKLLHLKNNLFSYSKSTIWFLIKWFLIIQKRVEELKSIPNMFSPEKSIPKEKTKNNKYSFNLKRNLVNIQVDINTQLLYIRLKVNVNTCSCGIWLATAFTASLSKSMKISVGSFPCFIKAFLAALKVGCMFLHFVR